MAAADRAHHTAVFAARSSATRREEGAEAVEHIAGRPSWQHAPVYLRTAQLNDERRVDDEGSVTSEPKRRSKSPARLEDTLEAIVENEDRAWAQRRRMTRSEITSQDLDGATASGPRRRRRRTTTAKREACAIWGIPAT